MRLYSDDEGRLFADEKKTRPAGLRLRAVKTADGAALYMTADVREDRTVADLLKPKPSK